MKLLALVRRPVELEGILPAVAEILGMALAEARMRLAGEPPLLIGRLESAAADARCAALGKLGLSVLALEEAVPRQDRLDARTFQWTPSAARFSPRAGPSEEVVWTDVTAILKGMSATRLDTQAVEKSKQFSIGAAVITGGLKMTKTTSHTERTRQLDTEQCLYVYSSLGARIRLREHALDFSCLGSAMQSVRVANMTVLGQQLQERAPHAFYDDRLVRLGPRALSFVLPNESRAAVGNIVQSRQSTASSLDVLADILATAKAQGLL